MAEEGKPAIKWTNYEGADGEFGVTEDGVIFSLCVSDSERGTFNAMMPPTAPPRDPILEQASPKKAISLAMLHAGCHWAVIHQCMVTYEGEDFVNIEVAKREMRQIAELIAPQTQNVKDVVELIAEKAERIFDIYERIALAKYGQDLEEAAPCPSTSESSGPSVGP